MDLSGRSLDRTRRRIRTAFFGVLPIATMVGCDAIADLSEFDRAHLVVADSGAGASGSKGMSGSATGTSGSSVTGATGTTSGETAGSQTPPDDDAGEDATMGPDSSPTETAEGGGDEATTTVDDSGPIETVDAGPPNLLTNPGFEIGSTSPWQTFSDQNGHSALLQVTKDFPHSGTYAGWVSQRTQTFEGAVQYITPSFVSGQAYTMSAYARVDTADAGVDASADAGPPVMVSGQIILTAQVICIDDAGTATTDYHEFGMGTANNLTWTLTTGTLAAIDCYKFDSVAVYVEGPDPSLDLFVDDVVFSPVP